MRPLTFLTLSTTDWDAPQYGSRQAIARSLAHRGHRVLFVEVPRALHSLVSDPVGTRRALRRLGRVRSIEDRLNAYTPLPILPVYYHPWTSAVNQRLLRRDLRRVLARLGWQPDVLWTYWPNSDGLCGSFGETIAVYHCIDDFSAASYPLVRPGALAEMEAKLCRRVDIVFASTEELAAARRRFNAGTIHLPTGVDLERFDPEQVAVPDAEVMSLPSPRIGFVGTLDDRIDVELIADVARRLPRASFVLLGPVKRHRVSLSPLEGLPNVRLLAPRAHENIPAVVAAFDVALLPYCRTAFTENLAPAKLYEYLAMGKPAVSTDLPFARRAADHLTIVAGGEALADGLAELIRQPPSPEQRSRWRAAAARRSWESRVDAVESALESSLAGNCSRADGSTAVLEVIASSRGGGASHVLDLARGLDPGRFRVEVVMPDDGGHLRPRDFARAGIPHHPLRLERGVSLAELRRLRGLMSQVQLVHAHGARAALWVRLAALSLGHSRPRLVYSIHGFTAPFEPAWRRTSLRVLELALSPQTDRYIAVCRAERDAVVASRWCSPEKVEVVRNGVDLRRFRAANSAARGRLALPVSGTLLTTICRLNRPRDFETLLSAFRRVADQEESAYLLIAGDGPWRREVDRRRLELGLQERVRLLGVRTDVDAILAVSDIFVLTSTGGDGLPLSILEAMAAGIPVVATATDGIPEAVRADETGLLVPRGQVDALAQALLRLIRDPQARARFGAAGRERADRDLGVAAMVAGVAAIYQELVGDAA